MGATVPPTAAPPALLSPREPSQERSSRRLLERLDKKIHHFPQCGTDWIAVLRERLLQSMFSIEIQAAFGA